MTFATAQFSELWTDPEASDALALALPGDRFFRPASDDARIGTFVYRDLKAPGHFLSYALDRAAAHETAPPAPEGFPASHRWTVSPLHPPARRTQTPDGPVAIFVLCRVEEMSAFAPSMTRHIEVTLDTEPGCLAFTWHRDDADPEAVLLYELYASRDALADHRRSTQLASFRKESEYLMLDARIHYAALVASSPLERLRRFFGEAA